MKKYWLFWLIVALFSMLIFCGNSMYAQFKIGNITIDNATAKIYFADLYLHPDTVRPKDEYDFLCTNCSLSDVQIQAARIMANDFNDNLKKYNIGDITDTIRYEAGNDTLWDGVFWADYDFKKNAKKITVRHYEAGSYPSWKGYLMPRQPSEQDFIKWYNKH